METVFTIGVFAMGLFCTVILIIGLAIYKSSSRQIQVETEKNTAADLKHIVSQLFPATPSMSVNGNAVEIQGSLSRKQIIDRTSVAAEACFENKRIFSKKRMGMSGKFRVESGFSADSNFMLTADIRTKTVSLSIPDIEILKLEPVGRINESTSNGWWNKLNDKDRNSTMDILLENAAEQVEAEGLKEKAEKVITERIRSAFSTSGYQVFIRHGDF